MPVDFQELHADRNQEWRNELRGRLSAKERSALPRVKMPEMEARERSRGFQEVNTGLSEETGGPGGEALPGLCQPNLHFGLPGEHQHPRVHQADRERGFQRARPGN